MQGAEEMGEGVAGNGGAGDGGGADGEDPVRIRAYHLWEAAGRPEGRDEEFWARASELGRQGAGDGLASDVQGSALGAAPDLDLDLAGGLSGPAPEPGLPAAGAARPE